MQERSHDALRLWAHANTRSAQARSQGVSFIPNTIFTTRKPNWLQNQIAQSFLIRWTAISISASDSRSHSMFESSVSFANGPHPWSIAKASGKAANGSLLIARSIEPAQPPGFRSNPSTPRADCRVAGLRLHTEKTIHDQHPNTRTKLLRPVSLSLYLCDD